MVNKLAASAIKQPDKMQALTNIKYLLLKCILDRLRNLIVYIRAHGQRVASIVRKISPSGSKPKDMEYLFTSSKVNLAPMTSENPFKNNQSIINTLPRKNRLIDINKKLRIKLSSFVEQGPKNPIKPTNIREIIKKFGTII